MASQRHVLTGCGAWFVFFTPGSYSLPRTRIAKYWGGENQVILAQKLIPFLFSIEKNISKKTLFSLTIKNSLFVYVTIFIHNFRQKFPQRKLLPETQFSP
ncbi:MAG: hypothetical protein DRR08_09985 [Candidatus Parabeggiatoa sp. nov. 2]|nr:MAG: hypothetical protein B6247_17015 [Beggiatoa sp. 4572_84]RKZ60951.1 MAG: hypothetical protein DRR08_09985 [Gammaproteobacteria bacterium]